MGSLLTCIEIAGSQSNYHWDATAVEDSVNHVSLFADRDYLSLSYIEIRSALARALDCLTPKIVVINGWGLKESIAALAWCCKRSVPRVVISDSQRIDRKRSLLKECFKKSFLAQCQAAFTGGKPHVRYLKTLGLPSEDCFVGCDVVDNEFFRIAASRKSNGHMEPKKKTLELLSCIRLIPEKNIPGTLKTLAAIDFPWHWTIAGEGPERKMIEGTITHLQLQDRVQLLGAVPYKLIPRLYQATDVYLQPSISEPWGLAVNEAMASRLPLLVSIQCGCHEDLVLEGVNGYTFDSRSAKSLAVALKKMWEDKDRWDAMGRESERIIVFWSLDLFAQNLWKTCELAMQRSNGMSGHSTAGALWKLL
jgi:glycosyltransferase involved in cell wall biosynthesis